MTIEIQRPELEALIRERMKNCAFEDIEEVLIRALKSAPTATGENVAAANKTGAALVAAMQASPYREIDLVPGRDRMPVRDISF